MVYDTVVMVMCNSCHSCVQVCVYLHLFVCYQHPYREEELVVMISKRLLGQVKLGFLSACASLSLCPSSQLTFMSP